MSIPARRRRAATLTLFLTAAAAAASPAAHASIADAKRGLELVSPSGIGARGVDSLPTIDPWNGPISSTGRVLMRTSPALPADRAETFRSVLVAERSTDGWTHRIINPVSQADFRHDVIYPTSASADLGTVTTEVSGFPGLTGEPLTPTAVDTAGSGVYNYSFASSPAANTWLTRPQTVRDRRGDATKAVFGQTLTLTAEDGSTTVFVEPASLTDDVPTDLGIDQLYRRRGNQIAAIARRVDGSLALTGVVLFGLSADGSRSLFVDSSAPQPDSSTAVDLLLSRDGAPTVLANRSRRSGGGPRVGDTSIYWARLTPDGNTVIFATAEQLVDGDTDGSRDLYRYRVSDDSLTLLSRGSGGAPGGNADDCSAVAGFFACETNAAMVSRDGRHVYFLSPEQLDGSRGDNTIGSLYVSEDGGAPRFVASVPAPDPWMTSAPMGRTSYAVTNQGDLVLESTNALGSATTGGVGQVFHYDAGDDTVTCLTCVTNRPGGGPPSGSSTLSVQPAEGFIKGTAAFQLLPEDGGSPRVTSDGSTVFVTSYDRLVADDQNEGSDVYAIDVATGSRHLVTTGRSDTDSYLYGATPDGKDVFFVTADSLDPRDDNGPSIKLYDARIGGGFAAATETTPCRGAACRVLLDPPATSTNGTQSAAPDETPPPEDLDAELVAPSAKDRARIATSGKLKVKVTGLRPGAVAALRVRVRLTSRSSTTATVTSRGGAATRTLTARFSRAQRLRIVSSRRQRSLPVELRLDHGADDPAVLTTLIARVRKGR